ncbi:MAG: hypothetical protein H0V49_03010 [Nocardioidaceae bacterium]|nr:hypothetical protein [Nocardioidaceae bacterium]
MFDEINGLPIHPLAVHVAVVLVPLAGLLGVLFAIPHTRRWVRVPLVIVAIGAVPAVFVAKESGKSLSAVLGLDSSGRADSRVAAIVREHAERADLLFILVIGFAVLAVLAVAVSAKFDALPAVVPVVVSVLLVLGAVALAFQTVRVGESGARAVWNPTGEQSFVPGD